MATGNHGAAPTNPLSAQPQFPPSGTQVTGWDDCGRLPFVVDDNGLAFDVLGNVVAQLTQSDIASRALQLLEQVVGEKPMAFRFELVGSFIAGRGREDHHVASRHFVLDFDGNATPLYQKVVLALGAAEAGVQENNAVFQAAGGKLGVEFLEAVAGRLNVGNGAVHGQEVCRVVLLVGHAMTGIVKNEFRLAVVCIGNALDALDCRHNIAKGCVFVDKDIP